MKWWLGAQSLQDRFAKSIEVPVNIVGGYIALVWPTDRPFKRTRLSEKFLVA